MRQLSSEAVTLGKATRELILEKSLGAHVAQSKYNQYIRNALGFRETNLSRKGIPVFASSRVLYLYSELDRMAKDNLPNYSHSALSRAWSKKKYTKDIERLLGEVGESIWGDPPEARALSTNPGSQLLSPEDRMWSFDLFYGDTRHRDFIALQLEHLMFVKAKAFCYNQKNKAVQASSAQMDLHPAATPSRSRRTTAKHCEVTLKSEISMMLVVRLLPGKLESLEIPSAKPKTRKRAWDDLQKSHGEPPREKRATRRAMMHGKCHVTADEDDEDNFVTDDEVEETYEGDQPMRGGGGDNGNPTQQPLSDEEVQVARDELTMLFYGEFCLGDEISHTNLPDAASMLEKSQQLDQLLMAAWTRGEAKFRATLEEQFEMVNQAVRTWLSWREGCWLLTKATKVHPFGGESVPSFTYPEWVERLGGKEEYRKANQKLVTLRQELRASGLHDGTDKTAQSTAEKLGWTFSAVVNDPKLHHDLQQDVVQYNKQLFAWPLELW